MGKFSATEGLALLQEAERLAATGSWEWSPTSGETVWSDNTFRLLGLVPGEAVPSVELFLERLHPDDQARMTREVERVARGGSSRRFDYRAVRTDGEVRHLRSIIGLVEEAGGRVTRVSGCIQDVTDLFRANREVAVHAAVAEALEDWDDFDVGVERLLRGLAEAFPYRGGSFWVLEGETMALRVFWHDRSLDLSALEAAGRRLRLARGMGLPGRVWADREPMQLADIAAGRGLPRRQLALDAGLRSALAFPALDGEEVLAVIMLFGTEDPQPSANLMRSLWGIGHEIGRFLAERRGEFLLSPLTPRELEVLRLSSKGYSGPQIAERLVLSQSTIKTHFEHIYEKLGVHNRGEAVATGMREGLID
jgi:DNA-binding CsgD family transcriptional regulator